MPGEAISVSLLRPLRASTPRITPSVTPGFSSAARPGEQASTITLARRSSFGTSIPITAAGAMPKSERAEKRPPISGTP